MNHDSRTACAVLADPSTIDTVAELTAQREREAAGGFAGGWYEDDTFEPDDPELEIPPAPDTIPAPPPVEARVVEECRALVHALAWRAARRSGHDADDLVQEAWLAALDAASRWREGEGVPLAAFASIRVRGRLSRAVSRESRRGLTARGDTGNASGLGFKVGRTTSLDAPIGEDDGGSLHDVLGTDAPQEGRAIDAELAAKLRDAVEHLPARDRDFLEMLSREATHAEIAARLGITSGNVAYHAERVAEGLRAFVEDRSAGNLVVDGRTRRSQALTHDGRTMPLADWARELGVPRRILRKRIATGWTVAEALTTPIDASKRTHGRAA